MKYKHLLALIAAAVASLALTTGALAADATPRAGVNYQVLDTPQPTNAGTGQVEVMEFFWYACPHCYAFEPYLENWLAKDKPKDVKFVRVPVMNGFQWAHVMARAFYTEKALGLVDKLHKAIFDEIHRRRHLLKSKEDFKKFFVKHGVDGDAFDKAWNSFTVAMNMKRAASEQKAYQIMGVPTLAIAGKYTLTLHQGQNDEDMLRVTDYLVKKESSK
ncbi:MAG TPA: thiol:disulfide interchange protein DsbA/DsbL [Gammaproteobacteria bacterium]|nr:thiol:disulfide interchange protein DsbA/DsbL [Gammaproteobacteria bacterium]